MLSATSIGHSLRPLQILLMLAMIKLRKLRSCSPCMMTWGDERKASVPLRSALLLWRSVSLSLRAACPATRQGRCGPRSLRPRCRPGSTSRG
eukprot:7188998-Alexandrium_andersonii.AAC.1